MKKVILFLLLLSVSITAVTAQTIFSDDFNRYADDLDNGWQTYSENSNYNTLFDQTFKFKVFTYSSGYYSFIRHPITNQTGTYSIEFDIRADNITQNTNNVVKVCPMNASDVGGFPPFSDTEYCVGIANGGVAYQDAGGWNVIKPAVAGQWYHIYVAYDLVNGTEVIYVDHDSQVNSTLKKTRIDSIATPWYPLANSVGTTYTMEIDNLIVSSDINPPYISQPCGAIPTDGCFINATDLTLTTGIYDMPNGIFIYPASGGYLDCNGATLKGGNVLNARGITLNSPGVDNYPYTIKNCIIEEYNASDNSEIGLWVNGGYTDQLSLINNTFRNNDRHLQTNARSYSFTMQDNSFEGSDVQWGTYLYALGSDHFDESLKTDISRNIWKSPGDAASNGLYIGAGGASWTDCRDGGVQMHDNTIEVKFQHRSYSVCSDFWNNLVNYTNMPGNYIEMDAPYVDLSNSKFYNNTLWYADIYWTGASSLMAKQVCVNGTGNYHYGGTFIETPAIWVRPETFSCYENITLDITPDMIIPGHPFKTLNNLNFIGDIDLSSQTGQNYNMIEVNPYHVITMDNSSPDVTIDFNNIDIKGVYNSGDNGITVLKIGKTNNVIVNNLILNSSRNRGINSGEWGYENREPNYLEVNNLVADCSPGFSSSYISLSIFGHTDAVINNAQFPCYTGMPSYSMYIGDKSFTVVNSTLGILQTYDWNNDQSGDDYPNITMHKSVTGNSVSIIGDYVNIYNNTLLLNQWQLVSIKHLNLSNNYFQNGGIPGIWIFDSSNYYQRNTHFVLNNVFDGIEVRDQINWPSNEVAYFLESSPGVYTDGNSYINGAFYTGNDPLQGGYPVAADVLDLVNNNPSLYNELNITAAAVGSPVVHFDWYVDGVLNQTDFGETFYVDGLQENTTYNISVFVHNDYGNDTLSELFTTNYHAPPVITDLTEVGDNYWTMEVDATVTGTYDYVDWYLNGQFVESGDTNIIFTGLTEATNYTVSAIARGALYGNSSEYSEIFSTHVGCNLNPVADQVVWGNGEFLVCAGTHSAYRWSIGGGAVVKFEPGVIIDGSGANSWDNVISVDSDSKLNCNNGKVNGHVNYNMWDGTIGIHVNGNNVVVENCDVNWHTHDLDSWYTQTNVTWKNLYCSEDSDCFFHGGGTNSLIDNVVMDHTLFMGTDQTVQNSMLNRPTFGHPDGCCVDAKWSGNIINNSLTQIQWGNVPSGWVYNFSYNIVNDYMVTVWDTTYPTTNVNYYGNVFLGNVDDTADYVTNGINWCVDGIGNYFAGNYNGAHPDGGTCPTGTPPALLRMDVTASTLRIAGTAYFSGEVNTLTWFVDNVTTGNGNSFSKFDNILPNTDYNVSIVATSTGNPDVVASQIVNSGNAITCTNLTAWSVINQDTLVCSGTHVVTNIDVNNAYVKFEPGTTVRYDEGTLGYPDFQNQWSYMFRPSNSIIDCQDGLIDGFMDWNAWQGQSMLAMESNNVIKNCRLGSAWAVIDAWWDKYNNQYINLRQEYRWGEGVQDSFIHGGGSNAYFYNVTGFGGLLMGFNQHVEKFDVGPDYYYVTFGHPDGCCVDSQWSGTVVDSNLGDAEISGFFNYNDPFNFTNNNMGNMYIPFSGNNAQQLFYNNIVTSLTDDTDYNGGDFIRFCVDGKGNKYSDAYYGGEWLLGTCNCAVALADNSVCTIVDDLNLGADTYTDVTIQIAADNLNVNCNNTKFVNDVPFDVPGTNYVTLFNIPRWGTTINGCTFDGYSRIAKLYNGGGGTTFNNITDLNHMMECNSPNDGCSYVGPGDFITQDNRDGDARDVTIKNSYIEGDVEINLYGMTDTFGQGDFCGFYTDEFATALDTDAVAAPTIAEHSDIGGFIDSYQTFIAPSDINLYGVTMYIDNFNDCGNGDSYVSVVLSTTPDWTGQLNQFTMWTDTMKVDSPRQWFFENGPTQLTQGETYYLYFRNQKGTCDNQTTNMLVADDSTYTDGTLTYLIGADGGGGGGTPVASGYDLIIGLIGDSSTPQYIKNTPNCFRWDYNTNGATEEQCQNGMWNADLSRCEDPRARYAGGNCVPWGGFNNPSCSDAVLTSGYQSPGGTWPYYPGQWFACNVDDATDLNFRMENNIINRSGGTIAYGANNDDGRANQFFSHMLFPYVGIAKGVYLYNNTWIWPESTGYEDPIDGWVDSQHSLMARFEGVKGGEIKDNTFWNGKAGVSMVGVLTQFWNQEGQPGCGNINIDYSNNHLYPTEAFNSHGMDLAGLQNVVIADNIIDARGTSNGNAINYQCLAGFKDRNVTIRGNVVINTSSTNIAQFVTPYCEQNGVADLSPEDIYIYDNNFSRASTNPNAFVRMGLFYSNGTDGRRPINVNVYNNTFENVRFWNLPETGFDLCGPNDEGNIYNGIFRINPASWWWYDGHDEQIINATYYLPDCNVTVGKYLEIIHNQVAENESSIYYGRNHTWTVGTVEAPEAGIRVTESFAGGSFTGSVKDIKVRGTMNGSVLLTDTTNMVIDHLDVQDPYLDFGLGDEFINMIVPAPVLSALDAEPGTGTGQETFGFSVYTDGEMYSCTLYFRDTLALNVTSGWNVNTKTYRFEKNITGIPYGTSHWYVTCEDKFGNIATSTVQQLIRAGGTGGGTGTTPTCTSIWFCSDWSLCSSGTQTRQCVDINGCSPSTITPPAMTQSCTVLNDILSRPAKWIDTACIDLNVYDSTLNQYKSNTGDVTGDALGKAMVKFKTQEDC